MRRYALTKYADGDYLVPSNDGSTLWRVSRYDEGGTLTETRADGSTRVVRGQFWQTWKWTGTPGDAESALARADSLFDFLTDGRWSNWSSLHRTRGDALEDIFGPDDPPAE